MSKNFFQIVGVQPASGRGFTLSKDDLEGAERVCIVQYDTWKNVFGGDPSLLGKKILLNNDPFTGIVLTASGLFIGVVGALGLGRLVQALLFRTSASDPPTLVIVAGILVSIALLASYLPARRAASVDPLTSLRYE